MSSKEKILRALRENRLLPQSVPPLSPDFGIRYAEPRKQFADVLKGVGGQALEAADRADLERQWLELPCLQAARKVCNLVSPPSWTPPPGCVRVDPAKISDPHQLEDIDVAIVPGEFAVAENAAVWIAGRRLPQRVVLFLTQHLVVVVPAGQVVQNLHEAYERLSFDRAEFGVFVSGPSKTADIEQSLVIGAHGPRSHTVYLLHEAG